MLKLCIHFVLIFGDTFSRSVVKVWWLHSLSVSDKDLFEYFSTHILLCERKLIKYIKSKTFWKKKERKALPFHMHWTEIIRFRAIFNKCTNRYQRYNVTTVTPTLHLNVKIHMHFWWLHSREVVWSFPAHITYNPAQNLKMFKICMHSWEILSPEDSWNLGNYIHLVLLEKSFKLFTQLRLL